MKENLEKLVSVMVNNLYERVGATISRNVVRSEDLLLMNVSITSCGAINHGSVDGFGVDLVNPEHLKENVHLYPVIFSYGKPDVVLDLNPNSFLKENLPTIQSNISFIVPESFASEEFIVKASEAQLNVVFLPEDVSEEAIMRTLRFLAVKKNEDSWGEVFYLKDLS